MEKRLLYTYLGGHLTTVKCTASLIVSLRKNPNQFKVSVHSILAKNLTNRPCF